MNKKEMLLKLKEYVEQGKHIRNEYHVTNTHCYCAIGYLCHIAGVSDSILMYGSSVLRFYGNPNKKNIETRLDLVDTLMDKGFSLKELGKIQRLNDNHDKREFLDYLDEAIKIEEELESI